MVITNEKLIDIWRYFQYCCLPSITMARYAYLDYIKRVREEKKFYRHETKQAINRIGKSLEVLPNNLMAISSQNIRYMNILGDNIDELLEKETEELHRSLYISFRNAKMKHLECFAALHYISVMLQIASVTFSQCCADMKHFMHVDPTELFSTYDLHGITERWIKIVDKATVFFGYDKVGKKEVEVDLNNPRCMKAIDAIKAKYEDIETLRTAMRKSYPWSLNYREDIPYEKSVDYMIVHNNEKQK